MCHIQVIMPHQFQDQQTEGRGRAEQLSENITLANHDDEEKEDDDRSAQDSSLSEH